MKNLKIYFGCSLKHAPQEYKDEVFAIREMLRDTPGVTILDFQYDASAGAAVVYQKDIVSCVYSADAMVAEVSLPSLGLGYEMATCIEKRNIPVFAFAKEDAQVSSLILGIPENKNFTFKRYTTTEEAVELLKEFITAQMTDTK